MKTLPIGINIGRHCMMTNCKSCPCNFMNVEEKINSTFNPHLGAIQVHIYAQYPIVNNFAIERFFFSEYCI